MILSPLYPLDGSGKKPVLPTQEENGIYYVKVSVDAQSLLEGIVQVGDPKSLDYVGAQSYRPERK